MAVRRLLLVVMVVLGLSAGVLPARAVECVIVDGTSPDETYECEGPEGVNVGDGDDIVYVIGEVLNTIVSNGGTVTVYIVGPDGMLEVLGSDGIYMNGDGNVTSVGDIAAGSRGIIITGSGDVTNVGDIITGGYGIYIYGNGQLSSSGRVTSVGDITAERSGIFIFGAGDVTSVGNITVTGTDARGIDIGSGNVTSVGDIVSSGRGIYIYSSGNVDSMGDIIAGQDGIYIGYAGDVTSVGDITASGWGIYINGNGDVTSAGNITAGGYGIYVGGNGVIDVLGNVHGDDVGIAGGNGEQVVLIDAVVVSGGSGVAVSTGGGNDRVHLGGNAVVSGDIRMGSGDDVVQIASGARVSGVIDGGAENVEDVLIVGDAVYCRDLPGGLDTVLGHRALVAGLDAAEAAFVSEGERYEVRDFERAVSGLSLRQCVGRIDDGRINAYDLGAWVAGYCNVEEGVNLWAIGEDGHGQADVSVDGATMRAALEAAVNSGQNVEIARGPRGTSLWALASGEYQMMGPDARQPGESYVYVFAPGTCGMSNVLS